MKNTLTKIIGIMLGIILIPLIVSAVSITVPSAPGPGYLLQSTTTGQYLTASLRAGSNITIATTSSSITISATGSGTVATSSSETAGQVPYATTNSGTPARLSFISTSTPTVTAPITYSGTLGAFIGGISGTFGCTTASAGVTGCLSGTDWSTFNNKGSGSVTSVATDSTLTGGTITTTGTLGINLATANTWTATATTTWTGANRFGNVASAKDNLLNVDCTGRVYPASVSVGGCVNIDNGTVNTGTALLVHGNVNNVGTGRMVVFNQENTTVTQDMILASSSCANCTALNIKGQPTGKGILKLENTANGTGFSNSSMASLDGLNASDSQGIFMDWSVTPTTGKMLNLRNGGTEYLTLVGAGKLGLSSSTPGTLLSLGTAGGINIDPTATSTFGTSAQGINLLKGCFAISGVCISGTSSGGGISDPFTHPAVGQSATSSVMSFTNKFSVGTPNLDFAQVTIATSTVPQLALGSGTATTSVRAVGNHFYIASSTSATATSTINAFDLNLNAGVSAGIAIGTSTPTATLDVVGGIVSEESSTTPSATPSFNWSLANQYRMLLTANVTAITFSNAQPGSAFRLVLCQDNTGSRTVAGWPTGTYWAGGTTPTMTATANKCDIFTFTTTYGTSTQNYLGGYVQNF